MNSHLSIALSTAVPLHIMEIHAVGGPTEEDLERARETSAILAEKGDLLLFRSKKKGETADIFNRSARAIAVLSFLPGGITLFGSHYDAEDWKRTRRV